MSEITGGQGVAAAYDAVGRDTFFGSLASLGYFGILMNYGQASGPVDPIAPAALAAKSNALARPILFHYVRDPASLEAMTGELFAVVESNIVQPETGLVLRCATRQRRTRPLKAGASQAPSS